MNISKNKRKDKRYQIRINGFSFTFAEQITVHKKIQDLLEKIPLDSKIGLRLSKKLIHEAQVIIRLSFRCNLRTSSENFNILLTDIFKCTDEEIDIWAKTPGYHDKYSSYFDGYPSYYREATT